MRWSRSTRSLLARRRGSSRRRRSTSCAHRLAKLAAMADRWATFDCYGTLIPWNGAIRGQLARVFGEDQADALPPRFHVLEPMLEADGTRSYREVLTEAMRGLGASEEDEDALARSLPAWQPFPEVHEAVEEAHGRGWKLAILSN